MPSQGLCLGFGVGELQVLGWLLGSCLPGEGFSQLRVVLLPLALPQLDLT